MKVDKHSVARVRHLGRHLPWLLLALVATLSSTGCTLFRGINEYVAYNDACDEFVLNWRNHVWSWQAWRARMHQFAGQPQFFSFGEGFRDGYQEVASGGDGCPPAIPPRRFWSYRYQSPEGQAKVAAWFAGYPYGVQAAREDGAAGFRDVQISGTTGAMYSSAYAGGNCPTCLDTHVAPGEGGMPVPHTEEGHPMMPLPNSIIVPQISPDAVPQFVPGTGYVQPGYGHPRYWSTQPQE